MAQKKARVTTQLHETFAKAFRMESICRTVKARGQFQKHLGLDCPLEGAEIGAGGRKKRQGNEQIPMEMTGKVVIPATTWGMNESGWVLWRRNAELSLQQALFEMSRTHLGEVS